MDFGNIICKIQENTIDEKLEGKQKRKHNADVAKNIASNI